MDKLRAATFTRGREREVKQASHIAAAGCVSACVCVNLSEIDHMIPFVHSSPCTPCAAADFSLSTLSKLGFPVSKESAGHIVLLRRPSAQTSPASTAQKIGHRHLVRCWPSHTASKRSLALTPLLPSSADVSRTTPNNHITFTYRSATFENKPVTESEITLQASTSHTYIMR